ncbi:MAG: IPT/TIG domain-containing protein, partial [Dehalococcoidales bacterium]
MRMNNRYKLMAVVTALIVFITSAGALVSADSVGSWSVMESGTSADLNAVWGADNTHVFAVGKSGIVLRYDGTSWSLMASATTADLYGIWGTGSADIFTVGKSGTIISYDGNSWSSMASATTADLYGIWGTGSSDIYAVGKSGTILRYDGTSWSSMASTSTADLYGIWGTGSNNILAVGKSGTILRYDGTTWSSMTSGTSVDIFGIWGVGNTNILAVGNSGNVLHYDGSSWSAVSSGTTANLNGIWGADSTHIYAAGESGVILNYDGDNFSAMDRDTSSELRSLWGSSSTNVFTVGSFGTILKYAPPVIYTILPNEGYQGETLSVAITGANFSGVTAVQFGAGISVNSFSVTGSNRIDVELTITSGAETGARNVTVNTTGGSFIYVDGFTVKLALPVITSLEPNEGRQGETLNVTITGSNLSGATALSFGDGVSVNSFTVLGANQIAANISVTPDAETGVRDISVSTPAGSFTYSDGFTVKQDLPLITSVEPSEERQGETLNVTITGANLSNASAVQFGAGISVNSFTVIAADQITADITISSSATTGVRDVSVTTPGGSYTLPNAFTVKQALPVITYIEPNQGRQGETLNITITGANFSGASALQFGTGVSVNGFNVLSSNQIAVNISISSDAATGARDVSVTTSGGSYTLLNGFSIKQAQPVITSISPAGGNRGAALTVTFNGNNLDGATSVVFGEGVEVTGFSGISQTQLRVNIVISSDAVIGSRDISVTTPGGSFTLPGSFMVKQELPQITSLSTNSANQGATLTVTISGANFTGASGVQFGAGISINTFSVLSPSQITANITVATGAAAGTRDVSVTTPGGSFVLPGGFTVKQALPVITSANPERGNPGSTLVVIVNGNNLTGTTSVGFGDGVEVVDFTNIGPTQLRVNINIKSDAVLGSRDITITTPGGSTTFGQGFNIELKSRNTVALISIWSGI